MDKERSTLELTIAFYWSLFRGLLNLAIGRLLPRLKVALKDLTGKTVVVTGGNAGLGFEMALQLAQMNAEVYLACRSYKRGQEAVETLLNLLNGKGKVHLLNLDNSSLDSVKAFADELATVGKKIDILIHNAGVATPPKDQRFTDDGFEFMYQTNFLSSFLMTRLMEEHLSDDVRVIFTTSTGQFGGSVFPDSFSLKRTVNTVERGFHARTLSAGQSASDLYAQTKMMQVALAKLLHERWNRNYAAVAAPGPSKRVAAAFTPGYASTGIFEKAHKNNNTDGLFKLLIAATRFAVPANQGAATGVHLATADDVAGKAAYWDRMTPRTSSADLLSKDTLDKLWIRWSADAGVEP